MKHMDKQYVYQTGGQTYINLTNRCSNRCDFCIRNNPVGIEGCDLWLEKEPEAEEVIEGLRRIGASDVVFCGYGEPTMRLDVLLKVARYVKDQGGRVRINTNGLGSRENGRNIAPELAPVTDVVSISLNQSSAEKYDAVCHSKYGKEAYEIMLQFARDCVAAGMETVMTVVDVIPKEDIERCRAIVEATGAKLRVREYSAK